MNANINYTLKLLIVFFSAPLLLSQELYNVGNEYVQSRQNYRQTHTAEYFKYPNDNYEKSIGTNLRIRANTILNEGKPLSMLNANLSLNNKYWTLYSDAWVVHEDFGRDILGASFSRFGMKGRYLQSFLKYRSEKFTFKLGRFPQRWGQSWSHGIMFSLYSLPFDQVSLQVPIQRWEYELFSGSFSSEMIGSTIKINRHIAGHKISRSLLNKKLLIEAGEIIIYTGEGRNWDIKYLNPFSLYYINMFDPSNYLTKESDNWNNDNAIMFFSARWIYSRTLSAYIEFILDDFQVDNTGRQNKLGFKLGMDGAGTFIKHKFTYELDYTSIDSWTYLNRGKFTNFENLGHSVGFPYGPDLIFFRVQTDSWLLDKLLLDIEYIYMEKGVNTLRTVPDELNNKNTVNDAFPRQPVTISTYFEFSLSWWFKYGAVKVGWSNIPFANQIAYEGNTEIDGSYYIKLQGHYTFSGF